MELMALRAVLATLNVLQPGIILPGASAISGISSSLPSVQGKPVVVKLCQQLSSSVSGAVCALDGLFSGLN